MSLFPAFIDLENKTCLVVGGGDIAARKIRRLLESGADVTVISLELSEQLVAMQQEYEFLYQQTAFHDDHIHNQFLVIAATDDEDLNERIADLCDVKNILVNVVNKPGSGNLLSPSVVKRLPIQIAISTGGASPVLARLLKARLETFIPQSLGKLASFMSKFREQARKKFPDLKQRRYFWEKLLHGPVSEMLFAGQERAAEKHIANALESTDSIEQSVGEVYLVGGGPGDPDLLTFRALRLMQQADVVLYDRLVAPAILDLVRQDARLLYVGKKRDQHSVPQDEINQILIDFALQGNRVLRLKGGDPFIFGRGGEEIEGLSEKGIPFQVVPGITAAAGCASYSGIPLTHRDHAQSCLFITGHLKDGSIDLNWSALIQPQQTLAIYMGTHGIKIISDELIAHGMESDMPCAIIEKGTTPEQRVFTSTLEELPSLPEKHAIAPPSLIVIGTVVSLHENLDWFTYR